MKKFVVTLVALVAALVILVPAASAQGLSYDSGFQVNNLSDTTANIVITYYNQDGTVETTVTDTVAPNTSNTYFPIAATAPFDGSVVISSDQPVAAIANVVANNFTYGSSYGAFSEGATEVNFPLIMKGNSGFNTWFNIQNAGSTATTVNVSYAGTACTDSATIEPGAAATFDQAQESCLPSTYIGAATITASEPIVGTAMQVGPSQLFAYNAFTSAFSDLTLPLINANNSGFITGVQVQNTGGAATSVDVTYTPVTGDACTETKSIDPGESATFALYAFTFPNDPDPGTDDCSFGDTFVGFAEVTSDGEPLVAIVNQLGGSYGSAYNGFNPASATTTVVMPLLMDRNSGFYTGFNIVAADGSASSVECTIVGDSNGGPVNVTRNLTLVDGVVNYNQINDIADGFVGAGTCVGDGPILSVVNELNTAIGGDGLYTYEAFNK